MANRDRLWGIVYVLPALALVLAFIAYPLASVVYHAFTEWDGIEPPVKATVATSGWRTSAAPA